MRLRSGEATNEKLRVAKTWVKEGFDFQEMTI